MNEFKDVFRYLRKRAGLTQVELAERLGLSKGMISMCENGERRPSYETLKTIADFFNVDMNYLLGFDLNSDLTPEAVEMAMMFDLLSEESRTIITTLSKLLFEKEEAARERSKK